MYTQTYPDVTEVYGKTLLEKLNKIFSFDIAEDQEKERERLADEQKKEREDVKDSLEKEAEDAREEKEKAEKEANDKRLEEEAARDAKSKV